MTQSSWWVERGFSAFDADPDGFPRPGQVVRHFRQKKLKLDGKPWTQRDVAQVLGKQELAVRELELRDAGLDDIARRRFLAHLFAIPPILLGLAAPERRKDTALTWWVEWGFPMFDADPDGFPRPGQVVRHFRKLKLKEDEKPWTQRDLALALGKQELAVRELELKDIGLQSISRRRFIAHLFNIPPILLGLAFPQQNNASMPVASSVVYTPPKVLSSDHVDLEEVREALARYWTNNANDSKDVLIVIDSSLKKLYERYPVTASNERLFITNALCELHIHSSNILRDRGKFGKAIEHLNKTKELNTLLEEHELQADVLYRRGGVYLERGVVSLALDDYHVALRELTNVSAPLRAAVLLETALSEARVALSPQERVAALKRIDRAGRIIRVERTEIGREQWPYLKVDLERYHLDRAATLISLGDPKEAQIELELLSFPRLTGRRSVYHLILQAQACFGMKEYAQAALLAQEALPLVRLMRSRVNLERIKGLVEHLQQSPFRNNPEVGHLDYLLFHT